MRKILWFAGFILLIVLLLSGWVFFGNFGELAFRFRDASEDLSIVEESYFVGSWSQNMTSDRFSFFADGTYLSIMDEGSWVVVNDTLQLTSMREMSEVTVYRYSFSSDYLTLTLIDYKTGVVSIYTKK